MIHPAPFDGFAEQVGKCSQFAVDRGRFGFIAECWFTAWAVGPHDRFTGTRLFVSLHVKSGDLGKLHFAKERIKHIASENWLIFGESVAKK